MPRIMKLTADLRTQLTLHPATQMFICTAPVHVTPSNTLTKRWRVHEAERRGLDPCQCNKRPDFLVDGLPRCANHAGQMAVKILMEQHLP